MTARRTFKIPFILFLILTLIGGACSVYFYLIIKNQGQKITQLNQYQKINNPLESQVVKQQILIDSLENELSYAFNTPDTTVAGVFLEVQVGNFRSFDITDHLEYTENINQYTRVKSNLITLGRFPNLDLAEAFLTDMKKLGFSSAFIVGNINGEIVDIEVALEALN